MDELQSQSQHHLLNGHKNKIQLRKCLWPHQLNFFLVYKFDHIIRDGNVLLQTCKGFSLCQHFPICCSPSILSSGTWSRC